MGDTDIEEGSIISDIEDGEEVIAYGYTDEDLSVEDIDILKEKYLHNRMRLVSHYTSINKIKYILISNGIVYEYYAFLPSLL
nr:CPPV097 hypothetical protein [Cooks petrelpox virus]